MRKIVFLISGIEFNTAPFNRFLTIVKAVGLSTYSYEILDIRPSGTKMSSDVVHVDKKTIKYDGVIIERTLESTKKSNNLFIKFFRPSRERIFAIKSLQRKLVKNETVVYLVSASTFDCLFYYFFSKIYKFKYVHERSEYPILIRSPKKIKTFRFKKMVLPWCFKLFDGMVIMTDSLIDFYSPYVKVGCKILKIPMTVDIDRFGDGYELKEKYIGYVGSLNSKKDGLDLLINAFGSINRDVPEYFLRIVGSSRNPNEKENLVELCNNLGIENKVKFIGQKPREQIPEFLMKSTLLVLARPDSKQAEGGFPTKLGEYLATGRPVIVTQVGEIGSYLEHEKNAYMVKPGSVEDLAVKMKQALLNYAQAKRIGKKGKITALENFDYKIHVERLNEFFESI